LSIYIDHETKKKDSYTNSYIKIKKHLVIIQNTPVSRNNNNYWIYLVFKNYQSLSLSKYYKVSPKSTSKLSIFVKIKNSPN
jgi:hypothetical protein